MNKKNILIIISFILAIILTAVITTIIIKHDKKDENKTNDIFKEDSNNNSPLNTDDTNEEENNTINNVTKEENVSDDEKQEELKNDNTSNETETKSEADLINYVEGVSESNNSKTLKEGFIKVVDFLFYDGKIYGKTFSELSNTAKIKVISLALKIDSKIDEYFPDYKENISNAANKAYTSIKSKLVTLYLDTTVKICSDNKELCKDAKQNLEELKSSFNLTWDFVKDISGIGLTKLKDWYEVWKEK